jgi:hypothetical protein
VIANNYRKYLLDGLWDRLARYASGTASQRSFLVGEITHVLSCGSYPNAEGGQDGKTRQWK